VAAPEGARRRLRWGAISALVTFALVVALAVSLVVLGRDRAAFNRLADLAGNAGARVVLVGVVVAAVHHTFDGLRVALTDLVPSWRAHDRGFRLLTRFSLGALGIPAAVVILWPVVSS
jgi:succinate dehydrogenase/fumarate reductase cytochrome b subunit